MKQFVLIVLDEDNVVSVDLFYDKDIALRAGHIAVASPVYNNLSFTVRELHEYNTQ